MPVTKEWKVYGLEGKSQENSFMDSVKWDWSDKKQGVRIFEADCFDKTGTHDYVVIRITRNTERECDEELAGQISDGFFENSLCGTIAEVKTKDLPDTGKAVTYKALAEDIQSYLSKNAWVKGYIDEQEIRARRPCHDAIEKTKDSADLFLEESPAAGCFYDIYANVCGCRIRVGCMENDGTIKRQTVRARFFDTDKYGELDATAAFLCMARDRLSEKLRLQMAETDSVKHKLEQLE